MLSLGLAWAWLKATASAARRLSGRAPGGPDEGSCSVCFFELDSSCTACTLDWQSGQYENARRREPLNAFACEPPSSVTFAVARADSLVCSVFGDPSRRRPIALLCMSPGLAPALHL